MSGVVLIEAGKVDGDEDGGGEDVKRRRGDMYLEIRIRAR